MSFARLSDGIASIFQQSNRVLSSKYTKMLSWLSKKIDVFYSDGMELTLEVTKGCTKNATLSVG